MMGYVDDLRNKRLQEFFEQLNTLKESEKKELLLSENFSIVSFSYGLRDGYKALRTYDKMIKELEVATHRLVAKINELCSKLQTELKSNKNVSSKVRKDFLNEIKKELLKETNEYNEAIKKLKKIKYDILLRIGNSFLYILSGLLSFGFGALIYLNNIVVNAIVYPISIITLLGFIAIQVLYTIKYLKSIKATIRGIIDFSIKRAFSTLLMVWWYIFLLAIVNQWNTNIVMYSFIAVFALNVVFLIFDMFLSSQLFDEEESIFSLIAAITIGIFYFTDSINNTIVKQIGTSILFIACFLLHILIIKKFILDKKPIKDILGIMNVVGIIATTIILTIVASYKLLWKVPVDGQTVDNTLFSAVVGLYAAILGGGLTLAGVAWTIKHGENQRVKDEKLKRIPYLVLDEAPIDKITESAKLNVTSEAVHSLKTVFTQTEIFVTNNADCIFMGIIVDDVYYASDCEKYLKQNCWYLLSEMRFSKSIKTNKFNIIVKDLLGNYYKLDCWVKEDAESDSNIYYNYVCTDIGMPIDITENDKLLIRDLKELTNE